MHEGIRLADLLREMKKHSGANARLASRIGVTEKTVIDWLKKPEEELHRLRSDNITAIVDAARKLGVEPECFESGPPLWNRDESYDTNLSADPLAAPHVVKPFRNHKVQFLGFELESPFGASASVITSTSGRIRFLALTGASLITFKTVRSREYRAHPSPNIFYCSPSVHTVDPERRGLGPVVVGDDQATHHPMHGMMNRFGMPSLDHEVWMAEFRAAKEALKPKQLLILSIVGTADPDDPEGLLRDFVRVAELAVAAGADVIELNLSCPNCSGLEGVLYRNVELVVRICRGVAEVAPSVKRLLKIGFMKGNDLEEFVLKTVPYVHGYAAINTVAVEGLREGQHGLEPAFGKPKLKAGLSGKPILRCGLRCVGELAELRERERLARIGIIGIGGVMSGHDVKSYLDSGADVVQATTGFFVDSYFGIKVRSFLDSELEAKVLSVEEEIDVGRQNWSAAVARLEQQMNDFERIERTALPVFLEWQREHVRTEALGPRRSRIPDVDSFRDLILARLASR